jgi:hypothetical protein
MHRTPTTGTSPPCPCISWMSAKPKEHIHEAHALRRRLLPSPTGCAVVSNVKILAQRVTVHANSLRCSRRKERRSLRFTMATVRVVQQLRRDLVGTRRKAQH